MRDVVKVSWSGGKDSTCALMKHIELGHKVKAVCYVPMFTEKIPLILKDHYDFINNTADKFRGLGADVQLLYGLTYFDYVLKRSSRGKYKGRMFGFPYFIAGQCGFKRDSKLKSILSADVGDFDYEDVAIAADEKDRMKQLTSKKRSILCELGITENEARRYCIGHDIYSPHYDELKRDGCALCPNAPPRERELWFRDYPEAVELVGILQDIVSIERPDLCPLRKYQWFLPMNPNEVRLKNFEWYKNNYILKGDD